VLRNGFSLKYWLRYADAKRKDPVAERNVVFERALKHLPGSYKLWHRYLKDRREQLKGHSPLGAAANQTVVVFERALVYMHKMPRIWIEYLELLLELPRATHTRHAFDRALRSLPVTQHERIWPLYLRFVSRLGVTETAVRIYRRYLKVRAPPRLSLSLWPWPSALRRRAIASPSAPALAAHRPPSHPSLAVPTAPGVSTGLPLPRPHGSRSSAARPPPRSSSRTAWRSTSTSCSPRAAWARPRSASPSC
jgi:hypothetical protein